jgi:uncharacterized Zn-finger protein
MQRNRALEEKVEQIQNQVAHMEASCEDIYHFGKALKDNAVGQMSLEHTIAECNRTIEKAGQVCGGISSTAGAMANMSAGTSINIGAVGASIAIGSASSVQAVITHETHKEIRTTESSLRDARGAEMRLQTDKECKMLTNEGEKQIRDILVGMESARIEVAQALQRLEIQGQKVASEQQGATRLLAELHEMRELTINKAAARNNPNFRIYRDDNVRNAEIAFKKVLAEAYKATLVFEYYTSQTYAFRNELLLARMINYGEYNLQNYIYDLEDAFWEFEDYFGVPELRVLPLSLKNDIFPGMRVAPGGKPYSEREMEDSVEDWLKYSLNEDGTARVSFQIGPEHISPNTRVHKISYVEACVEKQTAAAAQHPRIYLDMNGTSSIWGLGERSTSNFYSFGSRPSVVTARWCSGSDYSWDQKIFQSQKYTQRPLFNTEWELSINFTTEPANKIYRPEDFDDLKLFFYYYEYTDF